MGEVFLLWCFTFGGVPGINIDEVKLYNNITCFHKGGRNIHNNINVIIPNKDKNHWSIPGICWRGRVKMRPVIHRPTILTYPSTNCKGRNIVVFGGALMVLHHLFQFRLSNEYFILGKNQLFYISTFRSWYLIWRWITFPIHYFRKIHIIQIFKEIYLVEILLQIWMVVVSILILWYHKHIHKVILRTMMFWCILFGIFANIVLVCFGISVVFVIAIIGNKNVGAPNLVSWDSSIRE